MRNIYLTFILFIFGLILNCNNTNSKEIRATNAVKKAETTEVFSYLKPINEPAEPMYKTLYNGYSISINSNSSDQVLLFRNGEFEFIKALKFYYETPEIVFHLYKSNMDNFVIVIEGRDYYGSNLGVYYVEKKSNKIIEIDDKLTYNQDDPETNGFKFPTAQIIKNGDNLQFKFYLGNKFLYDKIYNISTIEKDNSSKTNEIEKLQKHSINENTKKTTQNVFFDLDLDGSMEKIEIDFNNSTIKGIKNDVRKFCEKWGRNNSSSYTTF